MGDNQIIIPPPPAGFVVDEIPPPPEGFIVDEAGRPKKDLLPMQWEDLHNVLRDSADAEEKEKRIQNALTLSNFLNIPIDQTYDLQPEIIAKLTRDKNLSILEFNRAIRQ